MLLPDTVDLKVVDTEPTLQKATASAVMKLSLIHIFYIPEENLGVRIEDDVLITPTGAKFLTAALPRDPDEIEKLMAEGKATRESAPAAPANAAP